MINVKDRIPTKVLSNGALQYGIYNEDEILQRKEYIRLEDEPEEIGTPIDRILFESIKKEFDSIVSLNPVNFVINSDLKIWQRGTTFVSPTIAYTADRFKCNGTGTVTKVDNGMKITGLVNVKYIMEDIDFAKINGKEVTLSYSIDNVITTKTFIASGSGHVTIFDLTITDQTLNWVKLELGNTATPYQSRLYVEELALCQRYYYVFYDGSGSAALYPSGSNGAGTACTAQFSTPVNLRTTPTIVNATWGDFQFRTNGGIYYASGLSGNINLHGASVTFNMTLTATAPGNVGGYGLIGGNTIKAFNAEIY